MHYLRRVGLALVSLFASFAAVVSTSNAQHWQGHGTWCIQPPIGGGTWSCYYYSERQCQATSYRLPRCVPNPAREWERRGFAIPPEAQPDYARGRATERAERSRR